MHSSAVTAMDWSRDSKFIKAIDQAYMKLFYDVTENVHIKDGSTSLSDPAIWETSTCKLGCEAMGVFPAGADGTDVNSVDANGDRTLLAAADDFGTVCIYKFPATKIT
jgi:microtubule-associated protein-like 6